MTSRVHAEPYYNTIIQNSPKELDELLGKVPQGTIRLLQLASDAFQGKDYTQCTRCLSELDIEKLPGESSDLSGKHLAASLTLGCLLLKNSSEQSNPTDIIDALKHLPSDELAHRAAANHLAKRDLSIFLGYDSPPIAGAFVGLSQKAISTLKTVDSIKSAFDIFQAKSDPLHPRGKLLRDFYNTSPLLYSRQTGAALLDLALSYFVSGHYQVSMAALQKYENFVPASNRKEEAKMVHASLSLIFILENPPAINHETYYKRVLDLTQKAGVYSHRPDGGSIAPIFNVHLLHSYVANRLAFYEILIDPDTSHLEALQAYIKESHTSNFAYNAAKVAVFAVACFSAYWFFFCNSSSDSKNNLPHL